MWSSLARSRSFVLPAAPPPWVRIARPSRKEHATLRCFRRGPARLRRASLRPSDSAQPHREAQSDARIHRSIRSRAKLETDRERRYQGARRPAHDARLDLLPVATALHP